MNMLNKKKFSAITTLLKAIILRRRIPFAVSCALTYRCNYRCRYCQIWNIETDELNTSKLLSILDELVSNGMHWISFTGGEPLLRDDIGKIIYYASKKNIFTSISSNGALVREKISDIRTIDNISLSLDGPEKIHDFLRTEGAYSKVMEAIQETTGNNIPTVLNTVLSKFNLHYVDYVLNIAKRFKVKVYFQPATVNMLGGKILNLTAPNEDHYKKVITMLIAKKRERNSNILNSIAGLKHLYYWPKPKKITCSAGKLHFRIEPNGLFNVCNRIFLNNDEKSQNLLKVSVKDALRMIFPVSCEFCWCASLVEFNLSTSFNPSAIVNISNRILKR